MKRPASSLLPKDQIMHEGFLWDVVAILALEDPTYVGVVVTVPDNASGMATAPFFLKGETAELHLLRTGEITSWRLP